MRKFVFIVLILLLAVLSVFCALQYRELQSLRGAQTQSAAKAEAQRQRLAQAEANVTELERQLVDARKPEPLAAAPSSPSGAAQTPDELGKILPGLAAYMDRPGMQRMMLQGLRQQVERRYRNLLKQLNLPPEQAEKLKALLVDRDSASMETMLAAAQKGLNPLQNGAELKQLVSETEAEADAQIKGLLGDSGYNQYQDYRQTEPQRNTVAALQSNLGYSDEPLSRVQASQLTELLATENAPNNGGQRRGTITDGVIEKSRSFLSPGQVSGLIEMKQQQEAAQAARKSAGANIWGGLQ